jgi:hypothetical protein
VGNPLGGGWSIMWNNLLEGAQPGIAKGVAAVAAGLGYAMTARSADRRWIGAHVEGSTKAHGASRSRVNDPFLARR